MVIDDGRPDPDALLRAINAEEAQVDKAKLRVFLGMSAGVGKTYGMLKAAHQRKIEGYDVVIGVIETHGRKETVELVEGIPVIPRKALDYKGTRLEEMDLDAILQRKPQIVLVDELAHSNIPGSRHAKRYQDVIEILDAGIDVYTAINVQHLESRKESVERITGIQIRETVPDSILERATQIELVDIAPVELLKRLKEGKVYLGEKADRAAANFFKEDRLTALREIALRLTAEQVDHELQRFVELQAQGPWQTNERLGVAISHSPYSEKLVRATRRLAFSLEAPWVAIYVDTGLHLNDEDQAQLAKNIRLARELNAEVVTTVDTDVPSALRGISRQKNITQLVVGRPTRRWVKDYLEGGSLLDRLVRESGEYDVHVLRKEAGGPKYKPPFFSSLHLFEGPIQYWNTLWFIIGVSFFSGLLEPLIGYSSVGFIYLLAVLAVGLIGSIGPVVFAAVLSSFSWNFFFIPPRLTLTITRPEDFILSVVYFAVALITGYLTYRVRLHQRILREREDRTQVLYEISQDIASSKDKSTFLSRTAQRVGGLLEAECGVLVKTRDGKLENRRSDPYSIELDEKDFAVASWAFDKGKSTGWSTDTLSECKALFLPLDGPSERLGVFVFRPKADRKLSVDQENMLHSIVRQLSMSLERHFFEKRLRETERLKESEKLHQTLLNSVSHEMRTPLTAIMGSAAALTESQKHHSPEFIVEIGTQLVEAADRLNRVIENLLDMSRLNSGALDLKREWHEVSDLIGVTLKRLGKSTAHHRISLEVEPELPMVQMDFRLMEHALSNLLINAIMYSPPDTEVKIRARKWGERILISVEDQGPGIPADYLPLVFEKFFRVPGTPAGGTGLGLSIVKGIVEVHKGEVTVENGQPHGARFSIDLPLMSAPQKPPGE